MSGLGDPDTLAQSRPSSKGDVITDRRIIDDALDTHFPTSSCDLRRRLLDHDHPKRVVLGVLCEQLANQSATCVGFVVMPDHVHAVVWFPRAGQLSRFVHEWKRRSSSTIRARCRAEAARDFEDVEQGDRCCRPRYDAFAIFTRSNLEEGLSSMHLKAVRAGLVARGVDWPWSPARWSESSRSVGVPIAWVPGLE